MTTTMQRRQHDPAAVRQRRAERLATRTGADRDALEELRFGFLQQLHRGSDDFAATEGLRTVETALRMSPRPERPWEWKPAKRDHPRRWWQRWRRRM